MEHRGIDGAHRVRRLRHRDLVAARSSGSHGSRQMTLSPKMNPLRHILSVLLLPATVTIVVPSLILSSRPFGLAAWPAVFVGVGVIGSGLALVCGTIWQFATVGRGTLAPWDPPKHFVITGLYRHVRNPMISGVALVLFGEALLFQSLAVLAWALGFLALNMIYIPTLEEPGLEQRFGAEYRQYKQHVPRWVPRRTAWTPPWLEDSTRSDR